MWAVAGFAGQAQQVLAAGASASASATVIAPVTIMSTGDFAFAGSLAAGATPTSIGPAARNISASSLPAAGEGIPVSFRIVSQGNAAHAVSVPSPISVAETGGDRTIVMVAKVAGAPVSGAAPGDTRTVLVSGAFVASPSTERGSYAGSFRVVIEYD